MTQTPTRPTDVRIHHADGTSTLCELAYAGVRDGMHTWAALTPFRRDDKITVAVLPGHTCISFPATGEGEAAS